MGSSAVSFCCLHRPETFSADTTSHSTATEAAHSPEHVLTFFFSWELLFWMWLLWNTEYVSMCKKKAINGTVSVCYFFFPPSCSPHGIAVSTEILLRVAVHPKALWWVMASWAWSPLPGIWKLQEKTRTSHARQVCVGCRISANWFACRFWGQLAAAGGHRPEIMPEGNSLAVTW